MTIGYEGNEEGDSSEEVLRGMQESITEEGTEEIRILAVDSHVFVWDNIQLDV